MLRRSTKIQLILFVVITLLGVSYVAAEYVGLAKYVTGDNGCKVSADFPSSGGIFTNAEVTYRGVTVGQVGALHLIKDGVRVDLMLDSCSSPKIPTDVAAKVANRSVVGEQYVDLEPTKTTGNDAGPFVKANVVLPMRSADGKLRNTVPVPTEGLLTDIDRFVTSVPLDDLRTTVQELRNATANRGVDLGSLLDAQTKFIQTASTSENLQATIDLIEQSNSVLRTQLDQQQPLASWTHSLALLSDQLKKSDPDFRRLLAHGSDDLATVRVHQGQPDRLRGHARQPGHRGQPARDAPGRHRGGIGAVPGHGRRRPVPRAQRRALAGARAPVLARPAGLR